MEFRVKGRSIIAGLLAISLGVVSSAAAQGTTGQITGTVTDNTKGVLPGVTVSVRNIATQTTREAITDASGTFTLVNLLAGTYDVKATLTGFKVYEQKAVPLTATERLALPPIMLEIGGLEETVTVTGETDRIQTRSGERSAVIRSSDLEDRGLKGRDPLGTLMTLPGVVDTSNRDAPGSTGGLNINGQTSIAFAYDGITSKDTGSNGGNFARPALDSIAQIKVQASNFQAEYGRSSGATIVVVTKSGSREFHGSFAYFRRDDAFNSNTWERKRDCDAGQTGSCEPPPYKYNNTTYTIGGPVILPKVNKNRDKLFFFWSHDILPRTDPNTLSQLNMPTALERAGDFSQTRDSQGRLIHIKDPSIAGGTCNVNTGVGNACFAGNIIPSGRISPLAQVMLNPTLLPLNNTTDPTGRNQYNYTYQNVLLKPRYDHTLRMDWNVDEKTTFYSRLQFGSNTVEQGYSASLGSSGNGGWAQFHSSRHDTTESWVNTLLHTFNQSTVMELTVGVNWADQNTLIMENGGLDAVGSLARNQRATAMPGLPQLFNDDGNPRGIIPNITWAGSNALAGTPSYSMESRWPFTARDDIFNLAGNITWIKGRHNMKFGAFLERTQRPASRQSFFNGTLNFNATNTNPNDSNFGLANLLLGNLNAYTESNLHPSARGRYRQFEFFVQDNWQVKSHFTIDAGMRFYYIGPTFVADQQVASFDSTAYNASGAVQLYQPVCANGAATCTGANRVAANPAGGTLPAFYIGKIVPNTGTANNGMVVQDNTVYKGVLRPAPRIGFAWDVTGDGRTAIRGGAGVFYDRYSDDTILRLIEPSPLVETRTYNFVNISELASASPVSSIETGARAFLVPFTAPTVYNWSIGVQRELPWKLVADVAYVGNAGRKQSTTYDANGLDYGTRRIDLNPSAADPTRGGTQAKDDFFFRPYVGYGGLTAQEWNGENNYHSIQVSLNRRFSNGLSWGAAYTGSTRRSLNTLQSVPDRRRKPIAQRIEERQPAAQLRRQLQLHAAEAQQPVGQHDRQGHRRRLAGDRREHVAERDLHRVLVQLQPALEDDRTTGGPGGQRVMITCDPNLPRGERTETRQFRTECVQMPGPVTAGSASGGFLLDPTDMFYLGNALGDEWLSLGYVNHDVTLFKNFAMPNRRNLQLRFEFYNLLNTVQFSGVDTSAQFNPNTGAQTDTNFGTVTGTRPDRPA